MPVSKASSSLNLSQLVLMGATGKIAVVSCSVQRLTALLIPVNRVNLSPVLMPWCRNGGFLARGHGRQMGERFAPAWWPDISSNTDVG